MTNNDYNNLTLYTLRMTNHDHESRQAVGKNQSLLEFLSSSSEVFLSVLTSKDKTCKLFMKKTVITF